MHYIDRCQRFSVHPYDIKSMSPEVVIYIVREISIYTIDVRYITLVWYASGV